MGIELQHAGNDFLLLTKVESEEYLLSQKGSKRERKEGINLKHKVLESDTNKHFGMYHSN